MKMLWHRNLTSIAALYVCLTQVGVAAEKNEAVLNAEVLEGEELQVAAFFGETGKLRQLLGDKAQVASKMQNEGLRLSTLAWSAVAGRHFEILDLLVSYGWPRSADEVAKFFSKSEADPKVLAQIAGRIPNFKSRFGEWCLLEAVNGGAHAAAKWLLGVGIRPGAYGSRMLVRAVHLRDIDLLKLLIGAGADPELAEQGASAVEAAARIRSAKALAALDTRGRYASLLAELRRDFTPPKGSRYIGNWVRRPEGGGFGTVQITLFDDGSATVLTDVVGSAGLWRAKDTSVSIQVLDERGNLRQDKSLEFEWKEDSLALLSPPGKIEERERRLVRVEMLPEMAHPSPEHPHYVRLEAAWLDGGKRLWLQINGRHQMIPMAQLTDAAKSSPDPAKPTLKNMLPWADFQAGAIPGSVMKTGSRVTLISEYSSPSYLGDKLALDHDHVTKLPEGVEIGIFPSGEEEFQDEKNRSAGEYASAFAIMSRSQLPHGKDWVRVFIRRSAKNPD